MPVRSPSNKSSAFSSTLATLRSLLNRYYRLIDIPHSLNFNSNHRANLSFESRSTAKGPEPEGVAVGQVDGRWYAFICFERISGVVVYEFTDPRQPRFVQYLGPEIVHFVAEADSPNGKPLLLVSNEVSGTVSVYQINQ